MLTKAELIEIQKALIVISETGAADVATVDRLRSLGYVFVRGDYPSGDYIIGLTVAGKSLINTPLDDTQKGGKK